MIPMIVRLGLLVAASIAAYAVKQLAVKTPRPSKPSRNSEANAWNEDEEKEQITCSRNGLKEGREEEEKEEVKLINGMYNPVLRKPLNIEDDLFLEFEHLLSGGTCGAAERDQNEMANNASELEQLRSLVKELEEREMKLEGELLEYYGLKEQESDILELQKQLKMKSVEIDMLNITINTLQAEKKRLQEEVYQAAYARKELEEAKNKIKEMQRQIQLEANRAKGQLLLLKQQVSGLQSKEDEALKMDAKMEKKLKLLKELEVEVMELRRKNKELQIEKRDLVMKVDAAEAKITSLTNLPEGELVSNVREEVTGLRHTNEDLLKQVEGLQMNRFSEVEELVYLRWLNACLRYELRNYQAPTGKISARDLNKTLSPRSQEKAKQLLLDYAGFERGQGDTDIESYFSLPSSAGSEEFDTTSFDSSSSHSKKPSLIQKLKKWGRSKDDLSTSSASGSLGGGGSRRRMSMATGFGTAEQEALSSPDSLNSVGSSFRLMSKSVEGVMEEKYHHAFKDRHKLALEREKQLKEKAERARAAKFGDSSEQSIDSKADSQTISKMKLAHIEKRAPRVLRPPPKPSSSTTPPPPPPPPRAPPPPPPASLTKAGGGDKVHRAPELLEFYQTLMKKESKKDLLPLISSTSNTSDARSDMIGEMANTSSFLLAVKADVETQGGFVQSLAAEVRAASFSNMDDLVAFVNWLDEELSFLVDERAVLKHFDWPEGKADALREAAFEYQDLMKLEKQVSSFVDDLNLSWEAALKKMYMLLEKVEQSVYALLRTRDVAISRYREFGVPIDWLLDSGLVGKIKVSSVQLACMYMKRVAVELDALSGRDKEAAREFIILQGVRFAFRVHQFAGGFDAESMKAFEELRRRVSPQSGEAKQEE